MTSYPRCGYVRGDTGKPCGARVEFTMVRDDDQPGKSRREYKAFCAFHRAALEQRRVVAYGDRWVAGLCEEHLVVQLTDDPSEAREFKDAAEAQAFVDAYSDAGYGLLREHCRVEEVPS